MSYSIYSENGNALNAGIQAHLARRVAQELADSRGEAVTLYGEHEDDCGVDHDDHCTCKGEQIKPTEIVVELASATGPRVVYGFQDEDQVGREVPAGWSVDFSNAQQIAGRDVGDVTLFSAPLVVDDATEALAEQLIASSAHHGEITSHAYSEALASALYAHSDDEADSGAVREYWGSEPGSWRVHLHRSTEAAS